MAAAITDPVLRKATRLRAEGRVIEHSPPTRVFTVVGDHGTYTVIVYGRGCRGVCTCPAIGTCSHTVAALLEIRADGARA